MKSITSKPVIVLDNNLIHYKDSLSEIGFKFVFHYDPLSDFIPEGIFNLVNNFKKLEAILSGRIFLTTCPHLLANQQIELNFDMIVIPFEAEPKGIIKIIEHEVQTRGLTVPQACWRLDIDLNGQVRFAKLTEES